MERVKLKLLSLIEQGKTYNEILTAMGMDSLEFSRLLWSVKTWLNYYKEYYADGSMKILLPKSIEELKELEKRNTRIITTPEETDIKLLVLSDLHIGCTKSQRLDLFEQVFNHADKEKIHIILNCGDILDGPLENSARQRNEHMDDICDQLDTFLNNYPQVDNVLTFAVLGNHEEIIQSKYDINIADIIEQNRQDIIVSRQPSFTIDIKNDSINLRHMRPKGWSTISTPVPNDVSRVNVLGHAHKLLINYRADVNDRPYNHLTVQVPALFDKNAGMVQINLHFDKGYIQDTDVQVFDFKHKPTIFSFSGFTNPEDMDSVIKNEEIGGTQKKISYR